MQETKKARIQNKMRESLKYKNQKRKENDNS